MHADDLTRVHLLARPQAGVVSRQQLVRAGFDHELPSREVGAGRWRRLLPGIYLVGGGDPTFAQQCHAAALHGGRAAVISGAAGWALHTTGGKTDPGHVLTLVPDRVQRVSRGFCTLVRTSTVPPSTTVALGPGSVAVAAKERCLADHLRHAGRVDEARAFACQAIRDPDLDWRLVEVEAGRAGRVTGFLSRVVRDLHEGVRSAAEGDLHDALRPAARSGRIPPYLLNPEIYVNGQFLGSPDAYFPGWGLGDEMDSRQWHEEERLLDATLRRHDRFHDCGLALNHTTPTRFRGSPQAHVSRLVDLLSERSRLEVREPAGLLVLARGPLQPHGRPWPMVAPGRLGLGGIHRDVAA